MRSDRLARTHPRLPGCAKLFRGHHGLPRGPGEPFLERAESLHRSPWKARSARDSLPRDRERFLGDQYSFLGRAEWLRCRPHHISSSHVPLQRSSQQTSPRRVGPQSQPPRPACDHARLRSLAHPCPRHCETAAPERERASCHRDPARGRQGCSPCGHARRCGARTKRQPEERPAQCGRRKRRLDLKASPDR
jgi:hypothetical protein